MTQTEKSSETLNEKIKIFNKLLVENLMELKKKSPEVYSELIKHGWYLGLMSHMMAPLKIGEFLQSNQIDEVDRMMSEEVNLQLDYIEKSLITRNPNRKSIIEEAFSNHRNGRYYSSIVLMLSQVDGMCKQRFDKTFFIRKRQPRKTNPPESELKDSITNLNFYSLDWMKVVFDKMTAINDSTDQAKNYPSFLNRHNILHGFDVEFGTELNSLKIISFLNYINDIVCYDLEKNKPRH